MARRLAAFAVFFLSACALQRQQPGADDHAGHMAPADRAAPATSASTSVGQAAFPASNNQAAARLAASPRHSEWVKIAWEPGSKDSLMAWVVYPASRTKAPVVVVVHEIFGLSTWVRGIADQVAAEGFIAIAPDLVSRVRGGPSSIELPGTEAQRLIRDVNFAERNRGVAAAASYAMTQPSAEQRYAVIGYCWGGQTVWGHSVNGGVKGFAGGVAFYGAPFMSGGTAATATAAATPLVVNADSLSKIKVPVVLLNGSRDARISAAMPQLDSIMKAMKKDYVGMNYEGATHGFLRQQNDSTAGANSDAGPANVAAMKDGWPRTVAFLKKSLKK